MVVDGEEEGTSEGSGVRVGCDLVEHDEQRVNDNAGEKWPWVHTFGEIGILALMRYFLEEDREILACAYAVLYHIISFILRISEKSITRTLTLSLIVPISSCVSLRKRVSGSGMVRHRKTGGRYATEIEGCIGIAHGGHDRKDN